jgi:hypothetical protein
VLVGAVTMADPSAGIAAKELEKTGGVRPVITVVT